MRAYRAKEREIREAEWQELETYRQRLERPSWKPETVKGPRPDDPEVVAQRAMIERLEQRVKELEFDQQGVLGGGARRAGVRRS